MSRKEKQYHFIYKTICLISDRYYIGMHSTDNLNDGYLGSGKRLWNSINYHGKENHKVEILEFCENRETLKIREKEIVNNNLLNEELCMNLTVGGGGGVSNEEHHLKMRKGASKINKILMKEFWLNPEKRKQRSENISIALSKIDDSKKNRMKNGNGYWVGKKHSDETKKKMSESAKGKNNGESNSQYGTCWITNGVENKKIRKDELIPQGWGLGRKIKK
jgi:hypothetical protein